MGEKMEVELEENIKRNQAQRFDDLVKAKVNEKPKIKKKESKEQPLSIENIIDAFKDQYVNDIERIEYVNFRYPGSKRIQFYCIQRKGFITVTTKDDSMASGWKSQRISNTDDLNKFAESMKAGDN